MATDSYLPYGRQEIDEDDIAAVVEVLRSDWLTTGPMVGRFEQAIADFTGARYGVAVSSGTAALHAAMFAIGIGPGDEVILPPMTFVATANAVVYQGGTPVFVDVEEDTLLLDPSLIEAKITPRTKAIIAVDYAGQPCDYDSIRQIAERHHLVVVADACHSLGAEYRGRKVGTLADLTAFSFHPVKPITTAEGGMVVTDDPRFAEKMRQFRNHGIDSDHRQRAENGSWSYQMRTPGYNYRLSDLHCALGLSQLPKLAGWIARRQEIAGAYDRCCAQLAKVNPLLSKHTVFHGYHLYVVRIQGADRDLLFSRLRKSGLGVTVHFLPVYSHEFYRRRLAGQGAGCPVTEQASREILSLPIFPRMTADDVHNVVERIDEYLSA